MDDRIERSTEISAPLARVWELVSEPGWWVGDPAGDEPDRTPGAVTLRHHEQYGSYAVQVVDLRPMTFASFRWASSFAGREELVPDQTTLIEFTLTEIDDAVRVTVVESGFTSIAAPQDVREQTFESNSDGWEEMLETLATRV